VYALGIANIGVANAKMLCRHFDYDLEQLMQADVEELSAIEGVGEVIATAFVEYMRSEENVQRIRNLVKELHIQAVQVAAEQNLAGKGFCITGSLNHYGSRNELKDVIEQRGGKVTGSVTSKTECLINNDIASNSSKNKKAKELGIPILTEEDFMAKYL
ncbi:MAG: NAD-dependent DNA ligase LigA, partial [Acetatifactor sp.]|nr:NAD-dependent DNA ligase LigA [Acetatifactor sp.]